MFCNLLMVLFVLGAFLLVQRTVVANELFFVLPSFNFRGM